MNAEVLRSIFMPFFGTALGAACVFFMKGKLNRQLQRALSGFAAGVMTAASVWSLLIPSIERSDDMGVFSCVPAVAGLLAGVLFLMLLDRMVSRFLKERQASSDRSTAMMMLAVAIHNLPEGMAVGVALAGLLGGVEGMTGAVVFGLAMGVAIQNIPEGAIISAPLYAGGMGKGRAFLKGVLSGAIEPVGAVVTLLLAELITPGLPYFLSFAAGAMLYASVAELIPDAAEGGKGGLCAAVFTMGFAVMMVLDVMLG